MGTGPGSHTDSEVASTLKNEIIEVLRQLE